ncbi:class I SAM-dependent methyltransferase [bacterium]
MSRKPAEKDVREANVRLHRAIAPEYDNRQAIYHPAVMENLRKLIIPYIDENKGLALDAGCGTGYILDLMGETGFDFTCFDLTEEMVLRAKEKHPEEIFSVADAFFPPFKEETFDLLTISGVFHHVVDYEKLLKTLLSLVKKGGLVFILNEPNALGYNLFAPVRPITRALIPERRVRNHMKSGELRETDEAVAEYQIHHGKGVYPNKIRSILEYSGFGIKKLEYSNLGILANIGDRISADLIGKIPLLKRLPTGKFSPDFNIVAERK